MSLYTRGAVTVVMLCLFVVLIAIGLSRSARPIGHVRLIPAVQLERPGLAPVNACETLGRQCAAALTGVINAARSSARVSPLTLDWTLTKPYNGCADAVGHARAMEETGTIWHVNAAYPLDSFPADVIGGGCRPYAALGQNVGLARGMGNRWPELLEINAQMMAEPHDPATCATTVNHACNLISATYTRIGVGIVYSGDSVYLVEDLLLP